MFSGAFCTDPLRLVAVTSITSSDLFLAVVSCCATAELENKNAPDTALEIAKVSKLGLNIKSDPQIQNLTPVNIS